MQPLVVSQQITQGVADFLRAAFPATTPGFDGQIQGPVRQNKTES
ncbi:hypothetical protein [Burkholderia sp. 3C]